MPLSQEQLIQMKENLDKAEAALKDAQLDIAQAKRAGIDVTQMEKDAQEMRAQIVKLRTVYLPTNTRGRKK